MKSTVIKNSERTRRQILDAAFNEFYKNGFQGSSINRILDEAGTTKGALFNHFRGKNVWGYTVEREVIYPHLKERWADPLANSTDPITDLKRLFRQCMKEEIANGRIVQGFQLNNLVKEFHPLKKNFGKSLEQIYV